MKKIFFYVAFSLISLSLFSQKDNKEKYYNVFRLLDTYNAVWRELNINYVDSLEYEKLNEIAINSMLQTLDPYTVYISKQQENDLKAITTGMYGGIGAIVQKHKNYAVISEPKFGLPAQKNGIIAGDEIISINKESMKDKNISYVSDKLKGIPGTEIKLTLRRNGNKKLIEKSFLREAIHINSIDYYAVIKDDIGYISLNDFTDQSYSEFKDAVIYLKSQNIKRLIIDLRNNGGGLVGEAVNIASIFLPRQTTVVTVRGKDKKGEKKYKTPFAPLLPDIPLAVIINDASASASEILAGAFQDLDRAVIVGQKSYGKGVVQGIKQLPYGNYLKVTTARYYLPSGRCVQAIDYKNRYKDEETDQEAHPQTDTTTNKFKTTTGRTVRDKSGITPDVLLEDKKGNYVSYYLFVDNVIFDYATKYYYSHSGITTPDSFNITDEEYNNFVAFVKEQKFIYKSESEKMLNQLKKMVEIEGYTKQTDSIFNRLSPILKPNIDRDLKDFREDIQVMLESEIVKRYYYQKGVSQFMLRYDKWLDKAMETFLMK